MNDQELLALVAAWQAGELRPAQRRELARHLETDPALLARFLAELQAEGELVAALGADPELVRRRTLDLLGQDGTSRRVRVLEQVRQRLDHPEPGPRPRRPRRRASRRRSRLVPILIAAVALAAVGFLVLDPASPPDAAPEVATPPFARVVAGAVIEAQTALLPDAWYRADAAGAVLLLDDGSRLELDAGTRLRGLAATDRLELVVDRGVVAAEVRPRGERPLVLRSAHGSATVLGTRLRFAVHPALTRLGVDEGRVRFARDGGSAIEVGAGERSVLGPALDPRALPQDALVLGLVSPQAPGPADPATHRAALQATIAAALARGCDLVLTPALALHPADGQEPVGQPQRQAIVGDHPALYALQALARDSGGAVLVGCHLRSGDEIRNAALLIDGAGIRQVHTKQVLAEAERDRGVTRGTGYQPFALGDLRAGALVSKDTYGDQATWMSAYATVDLLCVLNSDRQSGQRYRAAVEAWHRPGALAAVVDWRFGDESPGFTLEGDGHVRILPPQDLNIVVLRRTTRDR